MTLTGNFDYLMIELDEELHFNPYREETLKRAVYKRAFLSKFPSNAYIGYCSSHKGACLKRGSFGNYWSTNASEVQFNKPSSPGNLVGVGSPRWKQRAIYDLIKDAAPGFIDNICVSRISVWDKLPTVTKPLGPVLQRLPAAFCHQASIVALLKCRIFP
jgi:hypothetical protein